MSQVHNRRDTHKTFVWTEEHLTRLREAYARCPSLNQKEAATIIATAQEWPLRNVRAKLAQLYPPVLSATLPAPLPAALLAGWPIVEPGPFLWNVQVDAIGLLRWPLRYRYGEWPWRADQLVTYQGRLYRVQRVACSQVVLALVPEVQR